MACCTNVPAKDGNESPAPGADETAAGDENAPPPETTVPTTTAAPSATLTAFDFMNFCMCNSLLTNFCLRLLDFGRLPVPVEGPLLGRTTMGS